jgi:hypothetical protein
MQGHARETTMSMSRPPPAPPGNRLLARLPPKAYERLLPYLQPVRLKFKQVLYQARSLIEHAYFPNRGVLSVLFIMGNGSAIEVATVGREGGVGLCAGRRVSAHP